MSAPSTPSDRAAPRVQRLSRTDAAFLAAESREWQMHNGVLAVFAGADSAARLGT